MRDVWKLQKYYPAEKKETMGNLANEFDVCINTIKNDILYLNSIVPISTVRRKYGGIKVPQKWHWREKYLNDMQIEVINRMIENADQKDKRVLESILRDFSLN